MKCDKYNFLSNCSAKTCAHIHRVGVKYDKKLAMWWCKVKDKLYYSFNFLMDWKLFKIKREEREENEGREKG